ncbi:MAG TPA: BsuPI-related putative proteinase inhibitor [Chthoniobacterales bacterium]
MRKRVNFVLLPTTLILIALSSAGCFWKKKGPAAASETAAVSGPVDSTAPGVAAPTEVSTPRKRSFLDRVLHPFDRSPEVKQVRGLEFTVLVDDPSPSLSEKRQVQVTVRAANREKNMVNLTFTSSQRIEILARSPEGKIIFTWSEDRAFNAEYGVITINPGERIEYSESVPTRDMAVGRTYTIEAAMVGQTGMSGTATVTPRP